MIKNLFIEFIRMLFIIFISYLFKAYLIDEYDISKWDTTCRFDLIFLVFFLRFMLPVAFDMIVEAYYNEFSPKR